MKIRELKAELASHGVCAVYLLEKSELVRAVDEARAAAARKKRCDGEDVAKQDQPQQSENENRYRPQERTRGDDVGSMSIKQLKRELQKCGMSPDSFFEKRDMQEALRSAHSTDADATCGGGNEQKDQKVPSAAPNVFPSSLSESFGFMPKQRPSTTEGASDDLNSSSSGNTKRRSKEEGSQPGRQSDGEVNIKRMPQSYFPVDTFDSGTAGGEPMGGSPGAGLASDAVFPGTPRDTHVYHHHHHHHGVEADTTFVPASAERAQYQQHRPPWTQGNGKNKNVERRNYTSRNSTSYNKSPSSVTNASFEPEGRPEWLQM